MCIHSVHNSIGAKTYCGLLKRSIKRHCGKVVLPHRELSSDLWSFMYFQVSGIMQILYRSNLDQISFYSQLNVTEEIVSMPFRSCVSVYVQDDKKP